MMENHPVHEYIFRLGERMRKGIAEIHERLGIKAYVAGFGSVWTTYFMEREPLNYTDLMENDAAKFVNYRHKLLDGKYLKCR
jgi:glutamate-1-semialdehyde 2,1-aminomutase